MSAENWVSRLRADSVALFRRQNSKEKNKTGAKEDWVNWLELDHSAATCAAYCWEIEHLEFFYFGRDLLSLTTSDLLAYLSARRRAVGRRTGQGVSDMTIRRSINGLRSFYAFVGMSIARELPLPRRKKRVQRTLNWKEATAVLESCDTSSPIGRRDLAMLSLMLDTGLRRAEICRLQIDRIDLTDRLLRVVTKGGDEKFAGFSEVTANCLSAWFAVREPLAQCDRVFTTFELHRRGGELSLDGLRCVFRAIGKRSDVKDFSPHVLRRSMAVFMTLLHASARMVQIAGRWENLEEVEQYTRALDVAALDPYFPMAHLGGVEH